jgi:hypothetical protein
MLVNISAEFPTDIEQAARSDMRATFRDAIENRLRPRMDALVTKLKADAKYQKIADKYRVEQKSVEGEIAFAIVNDNPHSQYLIGGSRPHIIQQRPHVVPLAALMAWSGGDKRLAQLAQARIAQRGVTIHHPGIKPDEPVLRDIDDAEAGIVDGASSAVDAWVARFGVDMGGLD